MASQSLADLIRRGVTFTPADAVAIAQQLISCINLAVEPSPPFGPPTIDTVHVGADGTVFCGACASTPAVSEVARLIEAMLPAGVKMPGALRYAVARAFLDVDAPPFDSLDEFSAALARTEPANRVEVVRALYQRAVQVPLPRAPLALVHPAPLAWVQPAARAPVHPAALSPTPPPALSLVHPAVQPPPVQPIAQAPVQTPNDGVDRRRAAPSSAELRRHLRQADAALFASQSRGPHWALGGAM